MQQQDTSQLFISYVPMLSSVIGSIRPIGEKEKVTEMLTEAAREYSIQMVAWVPETDGLAYPILVIPHAKSICDHMIEWAEGKTKKYFTLVWSHREKAYAVLILPNFEKSARRFHTKRCNNQPLTIIGHIFTYHVMSSESFDPKFLRRDSIKVGFTSKINEDNKVDDYAELEMRVKNVSELKGDELEIIKDFIKN